MARSSGEWWRRALPAIAGLFVLIALLAGTSSAAVYIVASPSSVIVPAGQTQGTTTITWNTFNSAEYGTLQEDHGGSKSTIDGNNWNGTTTATVLCGQPNNFTLTISASGAVLQSLAVPVTCLPSTSTPSPSSTLSPAIVSAIWSTPTPPAGAAGGTASAPPATAPPSRPVATATACSSCGPTATPAANSTGLDAIHLLGGASLGAEHILAAGASPVGAMATYNAGWNIVAGPVGMVIVGDIGPIYTFQAGDTAYETFASNGPLLQSEGYWAYFGGSVRDAIPTSRGLVETVNLPASQWVMIGNSGVTAATVSGADAVYVYNPSDGYEPSTTLAPGQGAWAISVGGGSATIANG